MRVVSMALLVLICGCADHPSPIQTAISLEKPSGAPMPLVPLVPLDLSSQTAIDQIEASWSGRSTLDSFADALEALAAEHPPTEPLLLQRLAMLRIDLSSGDEQGLNRAIDVGQRLRTLAPESPETLYLEGWIPWTLLGGRSARIGSADMRTFLQSVVARWGALVERFPTYKAPRGIQIAGIAQEVERLKAILAKMPPAPPAAPPPGAPPATPPSDPAPTPNP